MPGETKDTKQTETKETADETETKKVETTAQDGRGETKADDGELSKALDESGDKGKEKPAPLVDLKLSVPDDLKDLVGKTDDYVVAAREAGIKQDQLEKFMAVHFDRVKSAAQEADQEAERLTLEWRRELMADPKLGGANLKATMQTAERGARALGGAALAVAVAKHIKGEEVISGPMLVRALHFAGLEHNEDRLGDGGEKPREDADVSPEERRMRKRYPSHYQQAGAKR